MLQLTSVSYLRFQSCKNIKVKTYSKYHIENTQFEEPAQLQSGKIHKTARKASVLKYIFNTSADMQCIFARTRLYQFWFLVNSWK